MLIPRTEPRILPPVPQSDWRAPSVSVPLDQFRNPVRETVFRLRGRLHDGHTKFVLWFDSRDDADHFLWALGEYLLSGIPIPREDWALPNHVIGDPTLYPELQYDFAAVSFLSGTSGSNQTYNRPADWNQSKNSVEVIAAGASGGARQGGNSNSADANASGGSGAAYARTANIVLGPTATYRLTPGGAGVATSGQGSLNGNSPGDSWFNGTTLAGSSVGAKGGVFGNGSNSARDRVLGGAATDCVGDVRRSGGRSGSASGASAASGGGGAAGPDTSGGNSLDADNEGTAGGDGASPGGGTGSAAGGTSSSNGGDGTMYGTRGPGGGSGAVRRNSSGGVASGGTSGHGGLYGAGSGGAAMRSSGGDTGPAASGDGGQALIIITNEPTNFLAMF